MENIRKEDYDLDFVGLGDITTDAFIKLTDADVHEGLHEGDGKELCVRFGDKIPYREVIVIPAVGNSPNASVSASRLGLRSSIITNIGDDENGKECLASLKMDHVGTEFVTIHKGEKTNYHYVLQFKEERTILIKHEEYPYKLPELPKIHWIYLSSLGENSIPHHHEIAEYLKTHTETKLAFQPGTFQIKQGAEKLKDLYKVTELFFCNVQEAKRILKTKDSEIKNLLKGMHDLGPKTVVVTDGPDGAYTYDGNEAWHMPMYPDPAPPTDRTGAGDSFSSTFTSFLALGFETPEALKRAPINSMSVVQYTGAQEGLLTRERLEEYLENAPVDYKPTQII